MPCLGHCFFIGNVESLFIVQLNCFFPRRWHRPGHHVCLLRLRFRVPLGDAQTRSRKRPVGGEITTPTATSMSATHPAPIPAAPPRVSCPSPAALIRATCSDDGPTILACASVRQ